MQQEIKDNRPFSTSAISYSTALLANLDPQTSTNHNVCYGTSLLLSPAASGAKQDGTPSTVRRTLPNDEHYLGHYHVSYSTALKGASGRRFYVDLTPAQESILLRKANRYVNAPKNQLKETLLTNRLFQQFIDLVASSSKERGRKAADRSEARVREKSFTEDQKRAAASRLAASAAAAGAAGRPDKPWSALGPRPC
jgi:hypothetical protein